MTTDKVNVTEKPSYYTTLTDGRTLDSYLACAFTEGFCEGENADEANVIRAWSYLIGTKQAFSLQGWFSRTASSIIASDAIDENGHVNWDVVNE